MTKKSATTEPTDAIDSETESAIGAAPEGPGSEEIREKISDLDGQTRQVDEEIAQLTQQLDALVIRAHVDHDQTAQAEIEELKRRIYIADHRPQIALARVLLEQELADAKDREDDERIVAMYAELSEIRELEDASVQELREALPVFARKVRKVVARLTQRGLLQRELTKAETGEYESGATWEHEGNVLRALAAEVAGVLQDAGLTLSKSDQDYMRGSIETKKAMDAAPLTPAAGERAN